MTNENMNGQEDSDWIVTDTARVRISGPADKGRTITAPGDAHHEEVQRRALMVARYVLEYDFSSVVWINGRTISLSDGSLDEEPYPGYDGRDEVLA